MIFTTPLAVNDVLANPTPNELRWQMLFISSDSACSNYHYQMMHTYYDVAEEYLKLYQIKNDSYEPLCITEEKYYLEYENPDDVALIIFVYDENLGQKELHGNKMGGFYSHSGIDRTQNHAIVVCDCPTFDYSSPVWILSHEISHFVLYYKNFEMSVIEDLIHSNDVKYDQCLESSVSCKSNTLKMQAGPGGYQYSVMPIYEPAVKIKSVTQTNENTSPVLSDISKIITKWWATDRITDAEYSNAIGFLVDSDVISSHEETELFLTDGPLDDSKTWDEMLEEITPTYWDREQETSSDSKSFLSIIPSNMIANDEEFFEEDITDGLPEWFKDTAAWWAKDEIADKEFKKSVEYLVKEGVLRPHASNVFQNLAENSESLVFEQAINEPDTKIPSDTSIESKDITENNFIIETEGIQGLVDFVNSMVESEDLKERDGSRLMKNLDSAVSAFSTEKYENGCNNLENYFTVVNYLIDTNKVVKQLGQTLTDAGDVIKIDSC